MSTWTTVAKVGDIPEGGVKVVRFDDVDVAVFHIEGKYYAIEDICTHDGGPLAEGELDGCEIECPRHGARFDVRDGSVRAMPATGPVPTFGARVEGEEIQLTTDSAAAVSEQPTNPHTGQPLPSEATAAAAAPPASAAPAKPAAETTPAATDEPKAAPSQQEMAIRSALETVMDPEINLSVIDLGLIREVIIGPDKTDIKMMLTTPFCPYAPQLMADVKAAAMSVVPQECEVEILADPWSPDLMPDPSLLGYSF